MRITPFCCTRKSRPLPSPACCMSVILAAPETTCTVRISCAHSPTARISAIPQTSCFLHYPARRSAVKQHTSCRARRMAVEWRFEFPLCTSVVRFLRVFHLLPGAGRLRATELYSALAGSQDRGPHPRRRAHTVRRAVQRETLLQDSDVVDRHRPDHAGPRCQGQIRQRELSVDQMLEPLVRQKFARIREHYNELRLDTEGGLAVDVPRLRRRRRLSLRDRAAARPR